MNKCLTIFLLLALNLLRTAHVNTMYVSLSGSDNASGIAAAPWRTIQHGVDALKPGDTLLVGPGTYRERIEIKQGGTSHAPIIIAALPGTHVIVSGADRLQEGWNKVEGAEVGVYVHDWAYRFPIGGWTSHFICKPPHVGKTTPWHEDSSYWNGRASTMAGICTVWLAIDEATPENSCMRVIPGSQANGFSDYEAVDATQNIFGSQIKPEMVDESRAVYFALKPNVGVATLVSL